MSFMWNRKYWGEIALNRDLIVFPGLYNANKFLEKIEQ
jgi:hypothetical protein